jgi:hypothetical protein
MESTNADKTTNAGQKLKVRKPYVAPKLQHVRPVAVKGLLSRDADASDTQLQQMIESVDQLDGAKGS